MTASRPTLNRRGVLAGLALAPSAAWAQAAALPGPSLSQTIGVTIAGADARRLAPAVRERARLCLIDNLGTLAFTAKASRGDHYLHRLAQRGGAPEARVLGTDLRLPWEDAAGALAFLIHYSETDDSDFRAELRASPTVMGPVLALAQRPGVTGADVEAAIAVGYSVLGGLAQPVGATQDDGLMSAGVWGPSASAAVAARLLRLSPAQTAHALGLAAGAAGGLFQYFYDQTEEKRLIVARAARSGVEAALLAQQGETGPAHIYEGRAGLYPVLAALTQTKLDTSGVASTIARLDGPLYIYPKFFAASSSITPSLEGLAPSVAEGLRASQVLGISLRGDPTRYAVVGSKLDHFTAPETLIGAKINYAYMLAFMLVHGAADAATVGAARLDDPRVADLARRVRFEPVAGHPGAVVVRLTSGEIRELAIPNQAPGSVAPPALALRRAKFDRLAGAGMGAARAARLDALGQTAFAAPSAAAWVGQVQSLMGPGTLRGRAR